MLCYEKIMTMISIWTRRKKTTPLQNPDRKRKLVWNTERGSKWRERPPKWMELHEKEEE